MRVLNIVIVLGIILITSYMYVSQGIYQYRIEELTKRQRIEQSYIVNLKQENAIITNDIKVLKDSINEYKNIVVCYNDSIAKIRNAHKEDVEKIYALNDSATFEYFKQYIEGYAERHGFDLY